MLIGLAIFVLVVAVITLAIGLRGRRTDDHPLCRRCGYDLTGRSADATRCPECGADLSRPRAIRVGHRVRRRGLVIGGALLAGPTLATLAVAAVVWGRGVDVTPYKPMWWLRRDLDSGPALQAKALGELAARAMDGRLPAEVVGPIADRALSVQSGTGPWDPAWGRFVEVANGAGRLDPPRWAAYARQAISVSLSARPTVRAGDAVPLAVGVTGGRAAAAAFSALFDYADARIDGRPVDLRAVGETVYGGHRGQATIGRLQTSERYMPPSLDGRATRSLAVGPHSVSMTVRLLVYDAANLPRIGTAQLVPSADPPNRLATEDVPVSASFAIFDAAHAPPLSAVDPAKRAAVAAAVRQTRVTVAPDGSVHVSVLFDEPPVPLRFHLWLRPPGGGPGVAVGRIVEGYAGSGCSYALTADDTIGSADRVDVIFDPAPDARRDGVDATPVWGEPIVLHDVPVTRGN